MDRVNQLQIEKFLIRMSEFCDKIKIIIIKEELGVDLSKHVMYETVEVKRLSKDEAVNFLKRVLQIERKYEFVKTQDLAAHPIIGHWEKLLFEDKFAFDVSRNLNENKDLNQYMAELT